MNLGYQLIPLIVFVGHGLVHKLIGHPVATAFLQEVGELVPEVDEVLLSLFRSEEGVSSLVVFIDGIEIV